MTPVELVLKDLHIVRHQLFHADSHGNFVLPPVYIPPELVPGTLIGTTLVNIGPKAGTGHTARVMTYGTGSLPVTQPGPAALTMHATRTGRRALRRKGSLTVSVHLAFRSSARLGATSSSKDFRVKLKGKKHR